MEFDFARPAPVVAHDLIGWQLYYGAGQGKCGGTIVETEAYAKDDPASHSFGGPTKRNGPMFMKPGTVYVYRIYGMHLCLNLVCGNYDGQAVLIRALLPVCGIEIMQKRRSTKNMALLCNGPAKLVQALGIAQQINGLEARKAGLELMPPRKPYKVRTSTRIGISRAVDVPWRFFIIDHL